jgi:hypothetical protein
MSLIRMGDLVPEVPRPLCFPQLRSSRSAGSQTAGRCRVRPNIIATDPTPNETVSAHSTKLGQATGLFLYQSLARTVFGALKACAKRIFLRRANRSPAVSRTKSDAVQNLVAMWASLQDTTIEGAFVCHRVRSTFLARADDFLYPAASADARVSDC